MYLKSIEVHGFKSFANKIRFEFHEGITAIVGPNGSGKSNVADAVRWVLGEQRIKQLRGASMQDVIFSGTETRPAMGYASVSITLDNSDHSLQTEYDEVTVTRKLFRSGESEYLLNGNVCRLKDVNELFYDTGIGKEGYSIIGQGQIDKILSGKPEERRELFDEAAGIVKFKKRKDTALKKLENEKQNLVRVNDILSELERTIGPLEKQSEKAREFLKYREELKKLDVNFFLLESERKEEVKKQAEEKLEIANRDLNTEKENFEKVRAEYDEIEKNLADIDKELEETRNSLSSTGSARLKLEGEIKVYEEQIHSSETAIEHFRKRIEALNTEITDREKEIEETGKGKENADADTDAIKQERDKEKAALDLIQSAIEELNTKIEHNKTEIINILNLRTETRSKKERYDTMLENTKVRKAELNSRFIQAKSSEEEQNGIIAGLQGEFDRINKELEELNYSQKKTEERLDEIHEELSAKDKELRDTQVIYHEDKSRLDAISNITERYEGYGGSVKAVMDKKEKDGISGIIGVVADIIKTEKKYETAIETALGGNIQNIVTEDEETAKAMITYLKEIKGGRATFLPLTSIKDPEKFKNPDSLNETGAIGLADSIVITDEKYSDVAKSMLGRILVVDNMDNALAIARKYRYGIRMVTLDGELLVPGGAISGGRFKNNSNLLGRRREMEELDAKVKASLKKIDGFLSEIEDIKKERNRLRLEVEEIKTKINDQYIKLNTAKLNLEKAQEKIDETKKGVDGINNEQEEIEKQVIDIKENEKTLEEYLKESQLKEAELTKEIEGLQEQLEEKRDEELNQNTKVTEKEVELEKALQKQEFEQSNFDRINAELEARKKEKAEAEVSIKEAEENIADRKHNIEEVRKTIEASFTTENDIQQKLVDLTEKREVLSDKNKGFIDRREAINNRMNDLDKEVYRLSDQKKRIVEELESLANYMWAEYELTMRDAEELKDPELTDLQTIRQDKDALKDAIKKLGDVNVGAIKEYQEQNERYTFLKTQHDDLIKASDELKGIIEELDNSMRTIFTEKFEEIGKEFDKVFKVMFGGGKVSLSLQEDSDILEAGVLINAEPPGKKLQNMMQLSGGEKALTAIALLFAIQNLKPSPFCLLDEIEAALDESNVGRYAGYLHKLTEHTQFIVITHRRGTMEKADRLYGITMQEKGISTLVSVNLIDEQLEN